MRIIRTVCFIMSMILAFVFANNSIIKRLDIDVRDTKGRYVLWRENEYYEADGELVFIGRNNIFDRIYVSYDDGISYSLFNDEVADSFTINPGDYNGRICIRFVNNEKLISKQFRIKFVNCNTLYES